MASSSPLAGTRDRGLDVGVDASSVERLRLPARISRPRRASPGRDAPSATAKRALASDADALGRVASERGRKRLHALGGTGATDPRRMRGRSPARAGEGSCGHASFKGRGFSPLEAWEIARSAGRPLHSSRTVSTSAPASSQAEIGRRRLRARRSASAKRGEAPSADSSKTRAIRGRGAAASARMRSGQ